MDKLEQKLKAYYENNPDYVQSEDFVQRLMALESSPGARKPRRRFLLPVAAAAALALGLFGWAILHASRPAEVRENAPAAVSAPSFEAADDQTELSKPAISGAPEEKRSVQPASQQQPSAASPAEPEQERTVQPPSGETSEWKQEEPAAEPEQTPQAEPDVPAPQDPEDTPPEAPDDTMPPDPEDRTADEPADPVPPAPEDPDPPEEPTPADDPPVPDEPEIIHMEQSDIDAVYRMKGGRELLTLTCLSTGACVELDVTGWMEEQPDSPEEPPAPDESTPTYTGRSSIVDLIFDRSIVYHLSQGDDGTVRVVLDVTDTGN